MKSLRRSVLAWYSRVKRDLPWRRTRDPYAIWVSEIMLQQTRVETVIPYYERFLRRFPDVEALARARESTVLAAWSGLGYYRRARHLHQAARVILREHGGAIPRTRDGWRALPGIGDYTAAAIASIAFGEAEAAVDGNVIRVLARVAGLTGRRDDPKLRGRVWEIAEGLARGPRPGDWTQALMELGATLCAPKEPRCEACPAARSCLAHQRGEPDRYPEPMRTASPIPERRVLLLATAGERVFLVRDEASWSLPYAAFTKASPRAARALAVKHLSSTTAPTGPRLKFKHRTYSHDFSFEVWSMDLAPRSREPKEETLWASPSQLRTLPLRAPTLKALKKLR